MTMSRTLELTQRLIACESVTPADSGCLTIIGDALAPLGFSLERIEHGGVSNLWARRGNAKPLLCFAGHTDVVPTGPLESWSSNPFQPEIRDGRLYGRGAADMKTSLAAFVSSIEVFLAERPDPAGSIALLLTSDEEGPAVDGTVRVVELLEQRNERPDYCIVGEPTSVQRVGDMIKNGRRGSLSGELTIYGVQGHVAYPHLARNPVHQAAPALAELAAIEWDQGNEYFPPTTWQISNIRAGTGANNVIPGQLDLSFNFRFATASDPDDLRARVTSVLDKHNLNYRVQWTLSGKPFLTPRGDLVAAVSDAIYDTLGIRPELSTTGGTSDGRFIANICREVVELGPVNASIHKLDEHIAVEAIDQLHAVYLAVLRRLLR